LQNISNQNPDSIFDKLKWVSIINYEIDSYKKKKKKREKKKLQPTKIIIQVSSCYTVISKSYKVWSNPTN
jgi:hypothetical protein